MPEVFTWCPLIGATADAQFRVRKAQFGDGYAQRAGDGLNTRIKPWTVSFRGRESYIAPIRAFLDAHAGAAAFMWTPPGGVQGLYVCERYSESADFKDRFSITATFERAFHA